MKSPFTKLLRLVGCFRPRCPGALGLALGALALVTLGWASASLAGAVCPPPAVDGNIDDLRTYAQCIETNHQGCGLDQLDPEKDICKFDPLIHPCALTVPCTGGSGEYFVNGYDMTEAVLAYDRVTRVLYLGFRVKGVIGDSNGDGTPDQTG